jgi:uncharacterized membrane-anchored protein
VTKPTNLAAKVPAITAFFWIIKVLSTTVGETFADYLNSTLGFGLNGTTWIMTGVLAVLLVVQFATKQYVAAVYWPTIVAISTVGTLITDSMHDGLGVENWQAIIGFGIALATTFAIWFRREKTLEMKSINTRIREAFYWVAILFTFALGTAGGDIFLDDLGVPLLTSFIGFGLTIAVVALVWRIKWLSSVAAFWIAYILTRPLGAALGDLLSQPKADTGLGLGATNTSLIFLGAIGILVAYLGVSKRDQLK